MFKSNLLFNLPKKFCTRCMSAVCHDESSLSFKIVVIGGGAGGSSMAAKLRSKVGGKNLAVIEPSDVHYYQPYFTLVGGGIKNLKNSEHRMADVLPKDIKWIKEKVASFDPLKNMVYTESGKKVKYEILIVAIGLRLAFEKIKGLPDAFETEGVCSNYSSLTVNKTFPAVKQFKEGNAIFTQPPNPIKCAGAPQKIMYLTEDNFRKMGKREKANILFFTALDTIFSAPKYAEALRKVADSKNIVVNYQHNLIEVKPDTKEAIFQKLGHTEPSNNLLSIKYEMIHITPPMCAPLVLAESPLSDSAGFLDLDKATLQHTQYPNVFGIGDCTSLPTSKTAAAVAAQCGILSKNIPAVMNGKEPFAKYYGYTSCPLVTGRRKGIIAEFDYDLKAVETLPFNQAKERHMFYFMKKDILPIIYWNLMLKGYWNGPGVVKKILHLGMA